MAYCPRCNTEYEEGMRECMDCRVALRAGAPPPPPDAPPHDLKLVPVKKFMSGPSVIDAELAKNLLESEGISCVVSAANAARLSPGIEGQVMVREEDAARAERILEEYARGAPHQDEPL